jgi:hypothetical protein
LGIDAVPGYGESDFAGIVLDLFADNRDASAITINQLS